MGMPHRIRHGYPVRFSNGLYAILPRRLQEGLYVCIDGHVDNEALHKFVNLHGHYLHNVEPHELEKEIGYIDLRDIKKTDSRIELPVTGPLYRDLVSKGIEMIGGAYFVQSMQESRF